MEMNSTTVRTSTADRFSKKTPFNLYLMLVRSCDILRSKPREENGFKSTLYMQSAEHRIWISNKLKPLIEADAKAFEADLKTNGRSYEIGLTVPSAEWPEAAWILYKKGEPAEVVCSIDLNAVGEIVTNVK